MGMRVGMRVLTGAAAAALFASACAAAPEPREEQAAPSVAHLSLACAADESPIELAAPGNVRVIELWATWCSPCIESMPRLQDLAREMGVEVLAVSIDDDREKPFAFAARRRIELPILWDPFARTLARAVPLGGVIPTTLVVDCEGTVRHVNQGFEGEASIEKVARQIEALRREPSCNGERKRTRCGSR